jgi:subfamily B ATP-binding cassette protein MsbA
VSDAKNSVWNAESWAIYKRLLGYSRRYWPVGLVAIVGMLLDAGGLALFTNLLRPMIDGLFVRKDPYLIFWMPIWIIGIFVVRSSGTFVSNYGITYIGRHVVQSLQSAVFKAYLRLPAAFFGREPSGQQVSRITYTSEQVASAASEAAKVAVTDVAMVVFMFGVMLHNSAYLTLALLILVPAIAVIATLVSRRYRMISRHIQNTMGSVTGTVEESVGAHREVRIYGGQAHEAERFDEITRRTRRLNLKIAATNATSSSTIQLMGAFAMAMLVFLGTRPGVLQDISPGVFFAVLTAMGTMLPALRRLANIQAQIQRGLSAAEDLFAVMDMPPEVDQGERELTRTRGDLHFEDVRLIYPRNDFEALRGVDLRCAPGTVTARLGAEKRGTRLTRLRLPRPERPTSAVTVPGAQRRSTPRSASNSLRG